MVASTTRPAGSTPIAHSTPPIDISEACIDNITSAYLSLTHPLSGFFSPTRFEADILDCVVTGTIPKYLNGAFYRLHGDWVYAPKFRDEASLSADGYISMLRFRRGSVDYRGRYVRTDRYNQQIAARQQL